MTSNDVLITAADLQPTTNRALAFEIHLDHRYCVPSHLAAWLEFLQTRLRADLLILLDAQAECSQGLRFPNRRTFFFELKRRPGQHISLNQREQVASYLWSCFLTRKPAGRLRRAAPSLRVRERSQFVPGTRWFIPPAISIPYSLPSEPRRQQQALLMSQSRQLVEGQPIGSRVFPGMSTGWPCGSIGDINTMVAVQGRAAENFARTSPSSGTSYATAVE